MKNLKNALLLKQLYQLKQLGYRYTSVTPYTEDEPNLSLPNTLESLKKQALNCHLCTLSKSRKSVVFGEGNPNATVMIIGDGPSINDDISGKIFTGLNGELLTKMIENVLGLRREDVYISNILKCTSADAKTPSNTHAHSCYPYVLKEIELVNPKIIITLGELAYHYVKKDDTSLEKVRGTLSKEKDYYIMPTYHPNYLLRNPSLKKEVFQDLLQVKALL